MAELPVLWIDRDVASQALLVELVGGPLDGAKKRLHNPPGLVWARHDEVGALRLYRRSAPGLLPYAANVGVVLVVDDLVMATYVYSGHTHVGCPSCGVYHARARADGRPVTHCDLCGHRLPSCREPA